jgi:hypothetical protein
MDMARGVGEAIEVAHAFPRQWRSAPDDCCLVNGRVTAIASPVVPGTRSGSFRLEAMAVGCTMARQWWSRGHHGEAVVVRGHHGEAVVVRGHHGEAMVVG